MHRPLLIASLVGSVLGGALPALEDRDASPDTIIISGIETRVITASAACDDEHCGIDSTLTTTATALATNSVVTTQTAYATAVRTAGGEDDESSPKSSPIPEEHSEHSETASASASKGQPADSHVSSSVAHDWPTLVPAVPGNQPKDSLDSLTPTNSSTLTFTLDGDSDPSTEHLFAELTANHTTPGVVLEHSAQIVDVSCADAQGGLKVDLSTQAALDFARAAWDENFIAITSSADCGRLSDSGHHSYWNVTAVSYPPDTLTALLDAEEIDIHDFLDHVHLVWGTHVPQSSAVAAHAASASSESGASALPTDDDDDDYDEDGYYDLDADLDEDDYDDEGDYLDSDAEFAIELQRFAPGLSTYASEDYEEDDSPAAVTGIGSDDYDIEDSGVIDPDQGDQLPAEAFQKRHEKRQPARADDRYKLPSYRPVMLDYYGGGSDRPKFNNPFWRIDKEREEEKERKILAKMTSFPERWEYQDARASWKESKETSQDDNRQARRLRAQWIANKADKWNEQRLKEARAAADTSRAHERERFDNMKRLEKLAIEASKKKKAAQSARSSPGKRAPSADENGRADPLAIQGDQLPPGAVEKRQDSVHGYEQQPDLFGYVRPPARKPVNEPQPQPRPARNRKYEKAQKSQKAKLAEQTYRVEDTSYEAITAKFRELCQNVQRARYLYWHAKRAVFHNPNDQDAAEDLEEADARLQQLHAELKQVTMIRRQLSKSARRAAKKKKAAQSVENAARRKRAAPSAAADQSGRADPLAVADQVAKDTLDHVKADPQLYEYAKATAGGLFGFLRNAYDQLAQAVSDVVSKFSTVKLDYPIPFNFSLAERPAPGWSVVEHSPWGEQVLMGSGSKDVGSGKAEVSYNLYCVDCGFTALIHIAGEISFSVSERKLTKGSITVEGSDIVAKLFLGLEGFYHDTYNYEDYILEQAIPPGFSIPKIITMGPAIRYGVRARLDLEAEGMILAGAEVHFSNFNATFDLVDDSKRSFAGLEPTYEPVIEAYGAIRAGFRLGYPYTLGITMHLPMVKKDTGVTITNEPYFKAEASYGDDKNCSKGIAYQTYVGNDVYANLLNLAKVTISKLKGPPIHSGCEKLPASILNLLPAPLSDLYHDDTEDSDPSLDDDVDSLLDKADQAIQAGGLVFSTVTAGSGKWHLLGEDDGTLSLVPASTTINDDDDDDDATLAQRTFAYINNTVPIDANDRLLYFSRATLADPALRVSWLALVDEDAALGADPDAVAGQYEAAPLVAVAADDDDEGGEEEEAVLVPMDTLGESYVPVACVVTDAASGYTGNNVFVVVDAEEGIKTLQSGSAEVRVLARGDVGECVQIAFDASEGI